MFRYMLVLCVGMSVACSDTKFNFSVSSIQNRTGRLYAQINMNFAGELPLDFYFDDKNITNIKMESNIASSKTTSPSLDDKKFTIAASNNSIDSQNSTKKLPHGDYEFVPLFGYYKVHTDPRSWQDALDSCVQEAAHLLILNSEKEAGVIINLLLKHGSANQELWIGLHDQYNNRNYVTIFNDTLRSTGYVKWFPGDPWGNSDQNCISFRYESMSRYGLRDWGCSLLHKYICEHEL